MGMGSVQTGDTAASSVTLSMPAETSSDSTEPACSFHDPARPFEIGFAVSQHSSESSLGSQVYLDPAYQEHVANLER